MNRKLSLRVVLPALVAAVALGLVFAASLDLTEPVAAVEYYHQPGEEHPVVQAVVADGLPDISSVVDRVNPCVVNIGAKKTTKRQAPHRPRSAC